MSCLRRTGVIVEGVVAAEHSVELLTDCVSGHDVSALDNEGPGTGVAGIIRADGQRVAAVGFHELDPVVLSRRFNREGGDSCYVKHTAFHLGKEISVKERIFHTCLLGNHIGRFSIGIQCNPCRTSVKAHILVGSHRDGVSIDRNLAPVGRAEGCQASFGKVFDCDDRPGPSESIEEDV